MRFSDGPTAEVTIHIDAAPSEVWQFVTDLEVLARLSDEFQGGEWLDPSTPPGVGTRFRGHNENPRAAWDVTCTLTDWDPGQAFGWVVEDPGAPAATWRFVLEHEDGGTRLGYRARMGPGPSGVTSFIDEHPDDEEQIIDRRLAGWTANMEATVAGIRELAEGRTVAD